MRSLESSFIAHLLSGNPYTQYPADTQRFLSVSPSAGVMGIGTEHGDPAHLSCTLRKAQQHGHVRMSAADNDEMPCHVSLPCCSRLRLVHLLCN